MREVVHVGRWRKAEVVHGVNGRRQQPGLGQALPCIKCFSPIIYSIDSLCVLLSFIICSGKLETIVHA